MQTELSQTIQILSERGRGILAADESLATIGKRFQSIALECTEEARRSYRDLLFTTPELSRYINGVILYEETLTQKTKTGETFSEYLKKQNIVPGIKVDKGLIPLVNGRDEKCTQGLDGLAERLKIYKAQGARFAKWRAVYSIDATRPSRLAVKVNAEDLARYAALCQSEGIVPIVEPECLIDGDHTIERCQVVTEMVLNQVFKALRMHKVELEYMLLKPSMVISGKDCPQKSTSEQVATMTLQTLLRCVPAAVPSINFLSGGQTPEEATGNLRLMNQLKPNLPWNLSFSYGRALQDPALKTWQGQTSNIEKAQKALQERAKLNALAVMGE